MRRPTLALAGLIALLGAQSAAAQPAPVQPAEFDPAGWAADLDQVREAMSSHYANLEWAVTEREAPLGQVFAQGRQRLLATRNEAEAREVFERLERWLGDGHVDIVWPRPGQAAEAGLGASADDRAPCERLGYAAGRDNSAVARGLPGYRPLDGDSGFPAGLVEVDGRTVGVIRIGLFSPQTHPPACAAALAELAPSGEPCDEDCRAQLWRRAVDRVTADFSERLRALRAAGATALLVDIAGNGGGTEWVEAVARTLTPLPLR